MKRRAAALVLLSAAAALAVAGCSRNPATGEAQFPVVFGSTTETALGDDLHKKVLRRHGGVYPHAGLEAMLRRVVARLAPHVRLADDATADAGFAWRVYLLDDPVPNAFAVPGGRVYLTRGMAALLNDEAELAALVGHEMAHVAARHGAALQSAAIFSQIVRIAAVVAGFDDDAPREAADLSLAAYSRAQESEADRLGAQYMAAAGYDPQAAPRLLRTVHRLKLYQERIGAGAPGFSVYRTHPDAADRIADVEALLREPRFAGVRGGGDAGDGPAYAAALDGMAWGDAPAAGFISGRNFVHPDFKIGFTVPAGYRLSLAPRRVVAENPSAGGLVLFDVAAYDGQADPADYLVDLWAPVAPLSEVRATRIAGFAAATGAARIATPQGEAEVTAAVLIDAGAKRIYRFACLAPAGREEAAGFRRMIDGFAAVTAAALKRRTGERIEVVTALPGETTAGPAARMGHIPHAEQLLRVLNGLEPGEAPRPGRPLKIIAAD